MSKIITDEQIQKIKDVYESNKQTLKTIEENDEYYDMYSDKDINEIFESGYNNALEYVMDILGIEYEKKRDE